MPGCTSTSGAIPSTPHPSATRSPTSSPTTRRGSGSSPSWSRGAEARLREEGIRGDIYLFKNNTDSAGNSYGCHENYLTERDDDFTHYTEVLIPFLVSRQIYAGAGKVLQTARGAVFCLSQRAEHIWEGVSSATTRSRPIINTRDEPHADAERFRRLHVIVGDSNMSEYATFLKVGATSILLRMLEDSVDGAARPDPGEPDPGHPGDQPRHHLPAAGSAWPTAARCSALDIQAEYLERALDFRDRHGLSPEEDRALDMWEHCLKGLEADPLVALDASATGWPSTGWSSSYRHAARRLASRTPRWRCRPPCTTTSTATGGSTTSLQRRDQIDRICNDDAITEAMTSRPQTTRARLRGEFVKRAKERRRDFTVDWVHLKLNDQAQRTVLLKDPFRSHDERVEKLIASL